jgi:hypothetical protein
LPGPELLVGRRPIISSERVASLCDGETLAQAEPQDVTVRTL